jgi:hypothetical protein
MLGRIVVVVMFGALGVSSACGGSRPADDPFPRVAGLTFEDSPISYGPSNLFDYINGAAESYLAYGFEGLTSQSYLEDGEVALVVDVYRHRDLTKAFGIYAQERPETGPFVEVGAEGYAQPGVVNFFKGPYYVKIMSYRTVDDRDEALVRLAREIADRLEGEATLPVGVSLLPSNGRVPHSERFIAQDFLGHGFLHSAFRADYSTEDGGTRTGFLLMPEDPERAGEMFDAYVAYARERGAGVIEEGHMVSFVDPYYRSSGTVSLALLDGAVFGMFGVERARFEPLVDEVRSAMGGEARGRL